MELSYLNFIPEDIAYVIFAYIDNKDTLTYFY